MNVSERFFEHIELLEGFRARAYRDVAGKWTIGIGHLIQPDEDQLMTATLTHDAAKAILWNDVQAAMDTVNDMVSVPLNQGQFDALVSFTFNIGCAAFMRSTLLQKLNQGHCCAVPDEMRRWVRPAALKGRREAEIALYVGDIHG